MPRPRTTTEYRDFVRYRKARGLMDLLDQRQTDKVMTDYFNYMFLKGHVETRSWPLMLTTPGLQPPWGPEAANLCASIEGMAATGSGKLEKSLSAGHLERDGRGNGPLGSAAHGGVADGVPLGIHSAVRRQHYPGQPLLEGLGPGHL